MAFGKYGTAERVAKFGGGGGANAAGTVGNTAFTQVSPMSDPTFANLFGQTLGAIPGSLPGIDQLIAQGMNSPLLQLVLGPALERLKAPQAQQREQFTESARAAGGLRGSTYGGGMNKLIQNQGLQQNDLMSQVIQQVLGTLVQGQLQSQQNQFLPARSMTDLLRSVAPQTVQGSMGGGGSGGTSGWENIPASQGLNTPMYGDISGPAGGVQTVSQPQNTGFLPPQQTTQQTSAPYTPYLDPFLGGGGGSYDIGGGQQWLDTSPQDPYAHTYSDWTDVPQVTEGWW